jgi:flagellar basal-body rod modification protein FlgD
VSTIDPLSALGGLSGTDGTQKSGELGQNEFLKLMLAQLKNQDPFKPTDPTQFLGQLAQFSTVTSIQNMEGSIGELAGSLRSAQVLNGATLVGHDVLVSSDTAVHTSGTTLKGAVDIPKGATAVQVAVRDSAGALVRRFAVTPQEGTTDFAWDGITTGGTAAPSGTYKLEIVASIGGEPESLGPLVVSRVGSVTIDSQGLVLNTGIGAIPIGDVRRVM